MYVCYIIHGRGEGGSLGTRLIEHCEVSVSKQCSELGS